MDIDFDKLTAEQRQALDDFCEAAWGVSLHTVLGRTENAAFRKVMKCAARFFEMLGAKT